MSGHTDRHKARAVLESDGRPLKNPVRMIHRYIETGMTTVIYENTEVMKQVRKKRVGWKGNHKVVVNEGDVRYCNQTELERLQTLPDGYTSCISRNKAAGCIGDGWTVDVIAHIFEGIKLQEEANNKYQKQAQLFELSTDDSKKTLDLIGTKN
jgi:DNA (cytosine-5)-methyltransferase 3A